MDLITNLSNSLEFDFLMVMVNHSLIKGVILIPCLKTISAMGVAKLFFENVFKWLGLHNTLICDRGPQFTSTFARELARLLQYDVGLSTAYHSQTDRQTKCTNQELETYLYISCSNQSNKWANFLPNAKFQHNSALYSFSIKVFPFFLMMGYEPRAYPPLEKPFFQPWKTLLLLWKK